MPTKREIKDKKTMVYKIKFPGSAEFMSGSLSSLADNFLHKNWHKDCKCSLKCETIKDKDHSLIVRTAIIAMRKNLMES